MVAAVGVLAATLVLGSCQTARVGARCRSAGAWGQDSNSILRCQGKRWVRVMSKADYARFLLAVQQQRMAEAEAARVAVAAALAPPPPPAPPRHDPCPKVQGTHGYAVLYVVPRDVAPSASVPAAIRHELDLVSAWYRREACGRSPRFLRDVTASVDVRLVQLGSSTAELDAMAPEARYWTIREEVERVVALGSEAALAYTAYDDEWICGAANTGFAIVFFGRCGSPNPAAPSPFQFDDTLVTAAHEIVHTMGAAQSCAPHHDLDHPGHVGDVTDILYFGQFPDLYLTDLGLDPGHDDYLGHGRTDCWDIALAPWWE